MGYEQLFWIVNYINKRPFERQELLAPAEQSRLQAKRKKIMSPRGEQGAGVIIASVTEECEGGDYGRNNASLLSLQCSDCIRMMSSVPGFVLNDICLLSLVNRTDLPPVLKRILYSLSSFTPSSPAYPSSFTVWNGSFYFHLHCIFTPVSTRHISKADMSNPPQPINPKFPPLPFPSSSLSIFTPKSSFLCLLKFN